MTAQPFRLLSLVLAPVFLILAALALVAIAPQSAGAGELCVQVKGELCLTLTPDPATNPIGTDHTATATVTVEGEPVGEGADVLFWIISGPNANANEIVTVGENGTASFTYTGSGGIGTDQIAAIVCEVKFCSELSGCLDENVACIEKIEAFCDFGIETPGPDARVAAGNGKGAEFCFGPAYADKTWEDPTPSPSPSPTPVDVGAGGQTPAPTPAQLPQSGGDAGGTGTPWFLAILGSAAVLVAGGGLMVARRRTSTSSQDS